jgi:4-methylaminobutanoate oxidase (formaldehyde-forming)
MHWPFRQYESARNRRLSPVHERLDAAGAVFGELAGWERANWFALEGQERVYEYSYGKQNWFDASGIECDAVRNAVGLFDQTSFAKFRVTGPDALSVLNEISANQIDVDPGRAVYTQWCNERGGIEADLTVTRLGDDEFLVVTAAASAVRDEAWLRRSCRGRDVAIADVTDELATFGVMGPNSRALLSELTPAPLDNDRFPFGAARTIEVAGQEVLALRMTYVGELGWELYVPRSAAVAVHDAIVDAGARHGLRHAGYHAMNTLRTEAGYRSWGHDLTDEDTPLEAGLGFAVDWDKPSFVGRDALLAQREVPRSKRLIQFRLEDPDRLLVHDEPIFRDGELVGRISSGMWSYVEDRCLAMGYVNNAPGVTREWLEAGAFEIEVATERIPATPSIRSFYDPRSLRVKV